jgi:hypothetical protein
MTITASEIFSDEVEPQSERSSGCPTLKPEAYHGPAGEFVRTLAPHTEADPAALLMNFLVMFGSIIGRNACFRVEGVNHYCNLFFAQVGRTSKGRKGTAFYRVREVMDMVDPAWAGGHIQSGLSSGEGLICAARFEDTENPDRRLLIYQSEFASTLKVMARTGNTLSSTIRDAWDSIPLQTLTRNEPLRVEGAHISIVTHCSRLELRRLLDEADVANGFANRFIWLHCERSKCLPEGGSLQEADVISLVENTRPCVEFARQPHRLERDPDAKAVWKPVYSALGVENENEMVCAVTSRAESQVMRLSMLYALLDRSCVIQVPHILAALAIWDYSMESIEWIFGESVGDAVADRIMVALRANPVGLTRTQISELFNRNQTASRINLALETLASKKRAAATVHDTNGRSAEIWKAMRA